ncbi:MAG: HlyC/CorC family transporter [Leptospiraceae bacterium]|nr:HlyC/CorC family transporter [Leptospiraceae bacterium]MCP5493235.1 HlyC/CorC family transporter [Leptospiraceae bacterium]
MGIFEFFIIIALVLVNGFFVAAEFAMVSIRPTRIEELIKENKPFAIITKRVIDKLNDMLSTCQVGITIASLLLGWLGEKYVAESLMQVLKLFNFPMIELDLHSLSITISFVLITFLHIIFGELVPKSISIVSSEKVALRSSVPLLFFYYLFYPITYFMNAITNKILKGLQINDISHKFLHTAEELMIILEEHNKLGRIDNAEFKIIQNTFEFAEREAHDVMTHRLSIVGISMEEKIEEILPLIAEHNFSRYPVYDKTIDKIIGIIHVQSYIEWMANPDRDKDEKITTLTQTPVFVPESLSIEKVLQKLRTAKQHLAIVVDEYGGVSGLLTLDDILEEIFGPIKDEKDDEDDNHIQTIKTGFIIDGEAELNELKEILDGENLDEYKDVRTIAGFFLEKHGDIPIEGSSIEISNGVLTIYKMEGNKIVNVKFDSNKESMQNIMKDVLI